MQYLAGVRVDSWIERGTTISPHYDSLLAKLMVFAPDRAAATKKMSAALAETQVRPCCANNATQHGTAQHSMRHACCVACTLQLFPCHQCKQPTNVCLRLADPSDPPKRCMTSIIIVIDVIQINIKHILSQQASGMCNCMTVTLSLGTYVQQLSRVEQIQLDSLPGSHCQPG